MAAAVALLTAVAPALADKGGGPAAAVARVVHTAIAVPETHTTHRLSRGAARVHETASTASRVHTVASGSKGTKPPAPLPLTAGDLRMRPLVPTAAWRRDERRWRRDAGPVRHVTETRGCVLCAGATARAAHALGGRSDRSSGGPRTSNGGGSVDVRGHAWIALAHAEATHNASLGSHTTGIALHARAQATLGLDAHGRARAALNRRRQHVDLQASAVAGARARAEQRVTLSVLGLSLQQTAGEEGWVGAGVTGGLKLEHDEGEFTVGARGGAALGLGGAIDLSTTVDATRLLQRSATARHAVVDAADAAATALVPLDVPSLRSRARSAWYATRRRPRFHRRRS